MENIFKKNGMCATPKSVEDLQAYLAKFSGSDAVVAFTVCGMTWNLCHEILKESGLLEQDEK